MLVLVAVEAGFGSNWPALTVAAQILRPLLGINRYESISASPASNWPIQLFKIELGDKSPSLRSQNIGHRKVEY